MHMNFIALSKIGIRRRMCRDPLQSFSTSLDGFHIIAFQEKNVSQFSQCVEIVLFYLQIVFHHQLSSQKTDGVSVGAAFLMVFEARQKTPDSVFVKTRTHSPELEVDDVVFRYDCAVDA